MFNIKDDIDLLESYLQAMKDVSIDNVCVLFATQNLLKDYKRLQKENEELKNNTRKNENELEFDVDCDWIALQKILDESEKSNEYILYKNEKWIKEKYCISVQKVKDMMKEKEWALQSYDCTKADYKQSQAIGAWNVLRKLLEGRK